MGPKTRLPRFAVVLGILGLLPFLAAGLGAVGLDPVQLLHGTATQLLPSLGAGPGSISLDAIQSQRLLGALIDYAAVILSFLGAVHWGLALAGGSGQPTTGRLLLGVMPALIGWVALLMAMTFPPEAGLGLLILGFMATMLTEARAARRDLMPTGYLWLRWVLSIIVVAVLVTVLVLRLLDAQAKAPG